MALYHHWQIIRERPSGDGIDGVSVQAYRHSDDSVIGSPVASATVDNIIGSSRFNLATTATTGSSFELHPGPFYTQFTHNGETVTFSSRDTSNAGVVNLFAQSLINHAMGNGFIQQPPYSLNEGACTANGVDRKIVVATFAATILGVPVFNHLARTIDISANASGNPRIDTVVLELVGPGEATEGKLTLKVVEGTPAASPAAPALTQTDALWQEPLCDAPVANGATSLSTVQLTDRRDFIERAVSDIEDDLAAAEDRLDDLEAATVPRLEIVAHYSATLDIGAIPPATWGMAVDPVSAAELTFVNGYLALDSTMFAQASHLTAVNDGLFVSAQVTTFFDATVGVAIIMVNPNAFVVNPGSGTLTVVVTKLVTS